MPKVKEREITINQSYCPSCSYPYSIKQKLELIEKQDDEGQYTVCGNCGEELHFE